MNTIFAGVSNRLYGHRVIRVSEEFLLDLLSQGERWTMWRCDDGLPKDARLVGIYREVDRAGAPIALVFEHRSWAPTPHGETLPEMRVRFSAKYDFLEAQIERVEPGDVLLVQVDRKMKPDELKRLWEQAHKCVLDSGKENPVVVVDDGVKIESMSEEALRSRIKQLADALGWAEFRRVTEEIANQ